MKLITRDVPPRAAWTLEQAGVHPLLARLYAARGVLGSEELDNDLGRLLPPASLKNDRPLSKSCLPVTNRFSRRTSGLIDNGYCDCWLSRRLASAPEVALLPDCTHRPSPIVAAQPLLLVGCTATRPEAAIKVAIAEAFGRA